MNDKKEIKTRIAPSPTGLLHIGTAHTALFNYLYAKKYGGKFVVRIEDTDKARCDDKFEKDIFEGLEWLGMHYDEMARQSERGDIYKDRIKFLLDNDSAYVSKEPAKDNPDKEVEVVRLRNPGIEISFVDRVKGEITFDTSELGDFVIARSVTDPLYHLAVVIDDYEMGITHIIRGDDHVSNTPRQILIQRAFGIEPPVYAHMPLILAADKSKLSKRKGAVAITEYREQGFLPEAINNYLALLGWNPGTDKEIYTMEEMIKEFTIKHIQKGAAVFDIEKLKWLNREHRKKISKDKILEDFFSKIEGRDEIIKILKRSEKASNDVLERFAISLDFKKAVEEGEFDFYEKAPVFEAEKLVWKKDKNPDDMKERLQKIKELLTGVDDTNFLYDDIKGAIWDYAEKRGRGDVLWPLRYLLSGKDKSPDPFLLAEALGKEEALKRIDGAISLFV
jgi:glutamyl-tRNA synthetase